MATITPTWVLALLAGCLMLSLALTAAVRTLALNANMLDVPNDRSSHRTPTPRGGGLAIVLSFVAGTMVLHLLGHQALGGLGIWLGAGGLVALLGLVDDRWQLRASTRLAGHLLATVSVVWLLGRMPPVIVLGHAIDLAWAGPPAAVLYLTWAVNFYNFMDGIDGIAALEAVTVGLGGALLNQLVLGGTSAVMPLLLAACAAGFLFWNWPPARIFMGDAGSGFLGLIVGVMTLVYAYQAPVLFWCWMILQGCFMVDSTTTLLRRVRRGQRASQAHRSHAYQYASRRLGSHRTVTLACGALTLGWLLPLAVVTALQQLDGALALAIAYAPLIALAYHFNAGAPEQQTC